MPDDYEVLFLQGGATTQFAMVPMNLLDGAARADYVNTGSWSKKAIKEAGRFCEVNVAASSEAPASTACPAFSEWSLSADAAYLHICSNETIGGVQFTSCRTVCSARWWPTCPRTSCPGPSTSAGSV